MGKTEKNQIDRDANAHQKPGVQDAGNRIISSVKFAPDAARSLADMTILRDMRFVLAAERFFFLKP